MARQVSRYNVNGIREGIRKRVEEGSLRSVAAAVGLSPNAVRGFLDGAVPHASSVKKYQAFLHAKQRNAPDRRSRSQERAEADAAVEVLKRYVNSDSRTTERARRWREISQRIYGDQYPAD
jgi:hypothetical protein